MPARAYLLYGNVGFLVVIALDLIEHEKLEVECSLSVHRVLQYFALPFPHVFGISGA